MKVAVASGGSPDYLIDIVADGIIRLLGRANVHLEYNRWAPTYAIYSQLMRGFAPDTLLLGECDVLLASRRVAVETVRHYRSQAGGRVAILDGEDWSRVHPELFDLCDVYFLREYLRGVDYPSKVRPLSFGAIPEEVERAAVRDVPVMFTGARAGRMRTPIAAAFKDWTTAPPGELTHDEYMRWLGRARIGLSAQGSGWDTYRYWETPWAGALLLSQRLGIVIEQDFVDGVEAVFFDSAEDAVAKARALLADEPRRAEIAAAGLRAVTERHLSIHRAGHVLNALGL